MEKMRRYDSLCYAIALILCLTLSSADTLLSRTATSDTYSLTNGQRKEINYLFPINMINLTGVYAPVEEVVNISFNVSNNFSYTIRWNNKSVTFLPIIHVNSTTYTISQLQAIYPTVNMTLPINYFRGKVNHFVNVTNLPVALQPLMESVDFIVSNYSNVSSIYSNNNELIFDNLVINFDDVITSGYTIGSLSSAGISVIGNLNSDQVFIDPSIYVNFSVGGNIKAYEIDPFTGICPHIGAPSNDLNPDQGTCTVNDISSDVALDIIDGDYRDTSNGFAANEPAWVRYQVNTSLNISTISSINFSWTGCTSSTGCEAGTNYSLISFHTWNASSLAWVQMGSYFNKTVKNLSFTVSSDTSNFFNSSNYSNFLTYINQSSGSLDSDLFTDFFSVTITYNTPAFPPILNTTNNSNFSTTTPILKWNNASNVGSSSSALTYHIQVDNNSDFSAIDYENFSILERVSPTNVSVTTLLSDGIYFWRVESNTSQGLLSGFNQTFKFRVDTTPPAINIVVPNDYDTFTSNTGIKINYTLSDAGVGTISSCWWTNSSGNFNYSITCGTNISVSEAGDGVYAVTVYANDTLNNVGNATMHYVISLTAPAVNINYPTNNKFINNRTNIDFNVTATDSDGIRNCSLFGNWSGTFKLNQTNSSAITSGVMANFRQNLTDGTYITNFLCFDQTGAGSFAAQNNTFTVDTIIPSVNITSISTTTGSQTVSFNSTYNDANCNNTFYSVINSSNGFEIQNNSLSCSNMNSTFAVLQYSTYTLKVYIRDKAGNENSTNQSFVTVAGGGGGGGSGGGGGGAPTYTIALGTIPVIGLNFDGATNYSSLDAEALYSAMNRHCAKKLNKDDLYKDYSKECVLNPNDFETIKKNLTQLEVMINSEDMPEFYSNYKNFYLFQGYEDQETVDKYNLFVSRLGLTNALILTPPSVDVPKFIIVKNNDSYTITQKIYSNKPLKSCEVISGTDITCAITNSTITISYFLKNTKFFNEIFSGTISVTTEAPADQIEQKRVTFVFRTYNLGYEIYPGIPAYIPILIGAGIIVLVTFLYLNKKRKNLKAQEFFKLR